MVGDMEMLMVDMEAVAMVAITDLVGPMEAGQVLMVDTVVATLAGMVDMAVVESVHIEETLPLHTQVVTGEA